MAIPTSPFVGGVLRGFMVLPPVSSSAPASGAAITFTLVKRRLATHEFVVKDDKPFPAFMMKKGKDEEWQNLIRKKGFWDLKGLPFIILCIKKFWLVIVFALTVVATNILAEYTKHRTKGFLAPPPEVQSQSPQSPTQEGQR